MTKLLYIKKGVVQLIKGINKQVIDIGETGNQYYERAILFLKPEYSDMQREILEREAKNFLKGISTTSPLKSRSRTLYWVVRLGIAAAVGSCLSIMVLIWF